MMQQVWLSHSRMTSQINGLNMAVRNANDAISMVQTADGALLKSRICFSVCASWPSKRHRYLRATDHDALDTEFHALREEINRIALNTEWNGSALFLDSRPQRPRFQVGANASQTISVITLQTLSPQLATGDGSDYRSRNLYLVGHSWIMMVMAILAMLT